MVVAVFAAISESDLGGSWKRPAPLAAGLLTLAVAAYAGFVIHERGSDARLMVRNFYGGLKVMDGVAYDSDEPVLRLMHGTITHGEQYLNPKLQGRPTTYYGPNSGVGRAIRQDQESGPGARGRDRAGDRHAGRLRPRGRLFPILRNQSAWSCGWPGRNSLF